MIGILTFHGSHNYGSVLQAYATQTALKQLGQERQIINFRMQSQKEYYSLYTAKFGFPIMAQEMVMIPLHMKRRERGRKFEHFIHKYLVLSGEEMKDREELRKVRGCYDLYLTGSDQIWSNRIPELVRSKEDFTGVYFLDFVDDDRRRIAYASSVGEITLEELSAKKDLLMKFDAISTREQYGVDLLENITGKQVELVLDPTFLLDRKGWKKLIKPERLIKEKYIFLYTLRGLKRGSKWRKELSRFAKERGLKFVALSPFFPLVGSGVHNVVNAGPLDFLNLIENAELVFTDSFHGTAFSINLNKPFYSFVGKNSGDNRKTGIMRSIGLENRGLESIESVRGIDDYSLDYTDTIDRLEELRNKSREWLQRAVAGGEPTA